ncbi:MAG: hypothetical protein IPM82_29995 [Saprospiraceae bacterium]|nr:hypothetical protein [Saprospiraceae bacterium]
MKYEVKIILYPELHAFFENLVRPIFENEGYKIEMNVNFTGLEIDLFGKHKNRDEKLLVE